MTQSASTSTKSGTMARWLVVLLGILVCGLLFFADKSNLENDVEAGLAAVQAEEDDATPQLPPVEDDEQISALQLQLRDASGDERLPLLDSLSVLLEARGRYDLAAVYAVNAATMEADKQRNIRAGLMAQKAMTMPGIRDNEANLAWFAAEATGRLEALAAENPESEEILLGLGLSYVYSGIPENSMKGILTIRQVLELNPDNVDASLQLGYFSLQTEQYDKAVARFEQVMEMQPGSQEARLGLATAYLGLGRQTEAVPLLETVVQESTDNTLRLQAGALLDNIR